MTNHIIFYSLKDVDLRGLDCKQAVSLLFKEMHDPKNHVAIVNPKAVVKGTRV